jgi:hypothetical protein
VAPMRSRQPSPAQWDAMSLESPAVLTTQATWLASRRAEALGYDAVTPELLLLGVLEDVQTPWPRCMSTRGCGSSRPPSAYPPDTKARPGRC